ncbi:RM21 protein, partial [Crocuta crocuta]
YVPKTSLSSPPWPEIVLPDAAEETRHHAEVVEKVNELIAVVHFASHQWKVTPEDLLLVDNELDVACGERIRLEKVLLVGADNFTLLGKPLLGKNLVRVEATVIEKTESWPKINMKFQKRKNYRRKKGKLEKVWLGLFPLRRRPRAPGLAGRAGRRGAQGRAGASG